MDKALLNVVILLAVLAFGIFFGVDMAKNGIEEVNGPIGTAKDLTVEKMAEEQKGVLEYKERMRQLAEQELLAERKRETVQGLNQQQQEQEEQQRQKVELKASDRSLLSKIFHKLGDVLSWLADSIIRGIVNAGRSIFT